MGLFTNIDKKAALILIKNAMQKHRVSELWLINDLNEDDSNRIDLPDSMRFVCKMDGQRILNRFTRFTLSDNNVLCKIQPIFDNGFGEESSDWIDVIDLASSAIDSKYFQIMNLAQWIEKNFGICEKANEIHAKRQLERANQPLREEIAQLKILNEEISARLKEMTDARDSLQTKSKSNSQELENARKEISDLLSKISILTEGTSKAKEKCSTLEKELEDSFAEIKSKKEEIDGLKKENINMTKSLEDAKGQLSQYKEKEQGYGKILDDAQKRIMSLSNELSEKEAKIEELLSLNVELDIKKKEIDRLNNEVSDAKIKIETTNKEISRLSDIEKEFLEYKENLCNGDSGQLISYLQNTIEKQQERISSLSVEENRLKKYETREITLDGKTYVGAQNIVDGLVEKHNQLARRYYDLNDKHSNLLNKHNALNTQYNNIVKKYNALNIQYNNIVKKCNNLTQQRNTTTQQATKKSDFTIIFEPPCGTSLRNKMNTQNKSAFHIHLCSAYSKPTIEEIVSGFKEKLGIDTSTFKIQDFKILEGYKTLVDVEFSYDEDIEDIDLDGFASGKIIGSDTWEIPRLIAESEYNALLQGGEESIRSYLNKPKQKRNGCVMCIFKNFRMRKV